MFVIWWTFNWITNSMIIIFDFFFYSFRMLEKKFLNVLGKKGYRVYYIEEKWWKNVEYNLFFSIWQHFYRKLNVYTAIVISTKMIFFLYIWTYISLQNELFVAWLGLNYVWTIRQEKKNIIFCQHGKKKTWFITWCKLPSLWNAEGRAVDNKIPNTIIKR